MTRVLVVTGDPVGALMAGPAIRSWAMSEHLVARGHDVRLVTTASLESRGGPIAQFLVRPGDHRGMAVHERWAETIVVQGHALSLFRPLRRTRKPLVADIYDPMHVEQLEQSRHLSPAGWAEVVRIRTQLLNEQVRRADLLLCASDRQRLFYLGQLGALGRLSPSTYADDPQLERLLAVVPFGLPDDPPVATKPVLRGVLPGFTEAERILVWGGGVYSWFDPLTLIRAVGVVHARRPEVRLVFPGTRHPGVAEMPILRESRELAEQLGLAGSVVVFGEGWTPYHERQNFLLEADAGVSTHGAHLETTLAFRTRILDYLWAGLPMVVSGGDNFGDLVDTEGLGHAVEPGDVDALAAAIEQVLFDDDVRDAARARVAEVRERYRWSVVLEPLLAFADSPRRAPDRDELARHPVVRVRLVHDTGLLHVAQRVRAQLREGGVAGLVAAVRRRLGRGGGL